MHDLRSFKRFDYIIMLLDVYIYDQRETHWWRRGHPGLRRFSQCVFKRIGSVFL